MTPPPISSSPDDPPRRFFPAAAPRNGQQGRRYSPGEIPIDHQPPDQRETENLASEEETLFTSDRNTSHHPRKRGCRRFGCLLLVLLLASGLAAAGSFFYQEMQTSRLQARHLSRYAGKLHSTLIDGPSRNQVFPRHGPYDLRLGYVELPKFIQRLRDRHMLISSQARFSRELQDYAQHGLYLPYPAKSQAGLQIFDSRGQQLYQARIPARVYASFADIPPLVVQSLLFIEDRQLQSSASDTFNPAVDWPRFAKAAVVQMAGKIGFSLPAMGGSTLATQTEKFRHSPGGVTGSIREKLVQMASASVRAYHQGEDTRQTRQQLVLDYVNAVPLSAAPGYGEVHGLGDGLHVWYGADFPRINQLLRLTDPSPAQLEEQARAFKQALSLIIAHRRPSYYLVQGRQDLAIDSNSHLRVLAKNGIIPARLAETALTQPLFFRDFTNSPATPQIVASKGVGVIRNRLAPLLDASLYAIDRLDLTVHSTIHGQLQQQVSSYLKSLEDATIADTYGLLGRSLLGNDQADDLSYSFTLFERTPAGNMVRVQTDTIEAPFDINEGSKLELGSTAKLRTLATYLEIIAELHAELRRLPPLELVRLMQKRSDALTSWTAEMLLQDPQLSLTTILTAAMQRRYSAHPGEQFFTGGGLHVFSNFRSEDDGRQATVSESLQHSLNLPFVRIMQDIVHCTRARQWENNRQVLADDRDPRRQELLDSFIDQESRVFLGRFWNKYQDKDAGARLDTLLAGLRPSAVRLAIIHRLLYPQADPAAFKRFIRHRLPDSTLSDHQLDSLYDKYRPGAYSWPDLGYLASLHPLELWLLTYLQQAGETTLAKAASESAAVRREVYNWLHRTSAKSARDARIRTMLEIDAFSDIHRRWKEMGYPFDHLVPSLATALGSSGDRPAALAELVGIILNDGRRFPTHRFTTMEFARQTPYETVLVQGPPQPVQVFPAEVARVLKQTMSAVVSEGTARRLLHSFQQENGLPFTVGGKTGTGDNRIFTSTASGERGASKALNRTATFVFYLGDNHFGTLTAFVSGKSARAFSFTSALPLQVLKGMAPILQPYVIAANKEL